MNTTRRRVALLLIPLGAMIGMGCEEAETDPIGIAQVVAEGTLDETALDLASTEVDAVRDGMVRDAERDRIRDASRPRVDRVGLIVELGGTAVRLAGRILDEQGATEEQLRWLARAKELLRAAEAALEAGRLEQAVEWAVEACWTSLKALVLPDGISPDEVRMIQSLAEQLLEEAYAKVGDDSPPVDHLLLEWAVQFYVVGHEMLEEGQVRGIAWLWKSAVLSAHILG